MSLSSSCLHNRSFDSAKVNLSCLHVVCVIRANFRVPSILVVYVADLTLRVEESVCDLQVPRTCTRVLSGGRKNHIIVGKARVA